MSRLSKLGKFYAMVILRVRTIYFFSHLPLRDSAHHFSDGPSLSPSC